MYRVSVDQLAEQDIAAAAAAHRELGREYEAAVAEGLIERIGTEIDKRVDARLGDRDQPAPPAQRAATVPAGWPGVVLALGSMGLGGLVSWGVIAASDQVGPHGIRHVFGPAQVGSIIVIWCVIGIINIAYARRR
jgi:hypothetical protein